ncbi:MAG: aminoacyl-histidine dipeptidase [Spirochaetales bacterium]|nr:aminoacyl-histidine dipeptidase [Spirochaetales bacterium]
MKNKIEKILNIFAEINSIPRKSKNEKQISDWLVSWGENHGFIVERDEFMDVLIRVPATPGYEDRPSIAFQGHMDMVCEKIPESNHDFSKDPIKMYQEDGWLKAVDTSLGADNGIAIAVALAIATDREVNHPELELLFTVDEETGLTGAVNLPTNWLRSKILINIDSEDDGVFTIGCAGGRDAHITLDRSVTSNPDFNTTYTISVGGLKGGHSGVDIHKEKGNALIIAARLLKEFKHNNIEFGVVSFNGGSAHNAIPRNSKAVISINSENIGRIDDIVKSFTEIVKNEFKNVEPSLTIKTESIKESVLSDDGSIIDLILSLPHGVMYNSSEMKGIVETSSNVAVISTHEEKYKILMSQRSSVMSRLDEICNKIDSIVSLAKGSVEFGGGYPAWQPDFNSKILKEFITCYKELFHKEPVIEVIHAGLECGVIGSKYSGMEMISIGPTIKNPHSPDEKMEISTLGNLWELLIHYLNL